MTTPDPTTLAVSGHTPQLESNEAFRKAGGALDGEDMPTFCARLISENSGMRDEIAGVWSVVRDVRQELATLTAERDQLREYVGLLTHKVICCGVAADHPDAGLTETGAYATKWNSAQAESVRKLRSERDQLLARLAAVDAAPASPNSKPR